MTTRVFSTQEIRRRFPCPSRYEEEEGGGGDQSYCYDAGGALVMFLAGIQDPRDASMEQRFPYEYLLADALRQANPAFPPYQEEADEGGKDFALAQAGMIIDANDAEDFDKAWNLLEKALQWDRQNPAALL